MHCYTSKYLNDRLIKVTNFDLSQLTYKEYKKTDLSKFNFTDTTMVDNISKIKQIDETSIKTYTTQIVCNVSEIAFVMGWVFGCSDHKNVVHVEKLGAQFGRLMCLTNDFETLEADMKTAVQTDNTIKTRNYIINFGFQNSFELFMDMKQRFIESALISDLYTNTLKDVVDMFEEKIDVIIDQTSPDLRSQTSSQ